MKWISVKERLPEMDKVVLVSNGILVYPSHRGISDEGYCWYNWGGISEKEDVTHWMPLPEPPQKGTP